MRLIKFFVLLFTLAQPSANSAEHTANLSIVIDDLGYSLNDFQALSLPKAITFAILPFTPQGKRLAERAHQQGREILVHIPMQAKTNNSKLGKGALMLDMQEEQFKATLRRSLRDIPYAQGINNHMGSTLTEQVKPMRWTMEVLLEQGLYFLDSRTTPHTVAQTTAKTLGVATLRRHVFLDNIKTRVAMEAQFQRAIHLTQSNEVVVIIAHPYPETLSFLHQKFNQQTATKSKLIALNQIIPTVQRLAMAQKESAYQQANNSKTSSNFSQTQ